MSDQESDRLFRIGLYQQAITRLEEGLKKQGETGRDLLLYLLDIGLAYHSAENYKDSIRVFLKADSIAEIKDYTSLSKETATLLVSDTIKDYPGEDFENVLISTYLAMNYALMGNFEDALVEARRVNHKLYRMVGEGKRKYKQSAFARYLSAILYETDQNYQDAYIDYKSTWALCPQFPNLGQDLWRCANELHSEGDRERWDAEFHLTQKDHQEAKSIGSRSSKGEIIVLYENGISPIKKPNPDFKAVPKFYPRLNPVSRAQIEVNGKKIGYTAILEDIETTAIQNLEEKYGALVAKKVAGLLVKGASGYAVSKLTDNPMLGFFTALLLDEADQADTRSWNLLPKDLQVLRIPLSEGEYRVRIVPEGASASIPEKTVKLLPGKKVFVNFRYMP